MTNKERLITLLDAMQTHGHKHETGDGFSNILIRNNETIADYLIENGVTFGKDTDALTEIEVVVREHAAKDWPLPTHPATCGLRWIKGGECYGQYFGFDKPEVPTDDLVKTINELLKLPFKEDDNG